MSWRHTTYNPINLFIVSIIKVIWLIALTCIVRAKYSAPVLFRILFYPNFIVEWTEKEFLPHHGAHLRSSENDTLPDEVKILYTSFLFIKSNQEQNYQRFNWFLLYCLNIFIAIYVNREGDVTYWKPRIIFFITRTNLHFAKKLSFQCNVQSSVST